MIGALDAHERLAALEAAAVAHTEALEKLERAVEKNFGRLAEAVRARPANAAPATPAPRT
jgi:hypothetical protein